MISRINTWYLLSCVFSQFQVVLYSARGSGFGQLVSLDLSPFNLNTTILQCLTLELCIRQMDYFIIFSLIGLIFLSCLIAFTLAHDIFLTKIKAELVIYFQISLGLRLPYMYAVKWREQHTPLHISLGISTARDIEGNVQWGSAFCFILQHTYKVTLHISTSYTDFCREVYKINDFAEWVIYPSHRYSPFNS